MSAGGYHHHLGLNTWAGEGAPPAPPGSTGLVRYEVVLAAPAELDSAVERLERGGLEVDSTGDGALVRDPSRNELALTVRK
jgi:catechol 2,3-dioxygenase